MDPELKQQLRDAVRARLDTQRDVIAERLSVGVAAEFLEKVIPDYTTTLETGYFVGDAQAAWTTATISAPVKIDLRWLTTNPAAERGVWQLFRAVKYGSTVVELLLASGKAGDAPGNVFKIDLSRYLPAKPSSSIPAVYRIRVTPGTKPKLFQGPGPGQPVTLPIPGKAVGPPSNDVVITYSAVVTPPVEISIFEIYQRAWFELDSIRMVEDQVGGGAEEFHVAGFVQETFPMSSSQVGAQQTFGPYYAKIDPDGPRTKTMAFDGDFYLNKPNAPEWPRAYTVVISILEEDDGGAVNEWQSSVWTIAQDAASGEVSQVIKEYLEEKFKDYIGENIGQLIQAGGQVAQTIATIIGEVIGGIVGLIVAAATIVITDIISGMSDDYYGTEVYVLVLPTNITNYIHTLPGTGSDDTGYQTYKLDDEVLGFAGYSSWPEATAWDGYVEVRFHWEFTNLAQS